MQFATFGAGCFWCVEAAFRLVRGVVSVTPGYSGGHTADPSYEEVCTGETGHAEVCQIEFDPSVVSYGDLLDVFFTIHDPTTLNRQGNDIGTQYRSVIFYHDDEQRRAAVELIEQLSASGQYDRPIVTSVEPFTAFYPAEEYHREYFMRNPSQPYCRYVIAPKIKKLEKALGVKLAL
ncbi:MAG: peptide-methionine (S)-S-oxide reductase MsrA [Candidatus Thorarchaeota archaeon]